MTEHLHELPETEPKPMTAREALARAIAALILGARDDDDETWQSTTADAEYLIWRLGSLGFDVLPAIPMPRSG